MFPQIELSNLVKGQLTYTKLIFILFLFFLLFEFTYY